MNADGTRHQSLMFPISVPNTFRNKLSAHYDFLRELYGGISLSFVNFADGRGFETAQRDMSMSALEYGDFTTVHRWSKKRVLSTDFGRANVETLMQPRGAGYWLWKPYIIHQQMAQMTDGDFLFYSDVGPQTGSRISESLLPAVDWLIKHENDLFMGRLYGLVQRAWTKRDCFIIMNCDAPEYWDHVQLPATYIGLIVGPKTRELVREWLRYSQMPRNITDDPNIHGLPNFGDFIDHRHDQSILTNCIIRSGMSVPDFCELSSKNVNPVLRWMAAQGAIPSREGKNLAFGKPCSQSSLSQWSGEQGANAAVNGPRTMSYSIHTEEEDDPWWRVDLEEVRWISQIHVFNRIADCAFRARSLQVLISENSEEWVVLFDAFKAEWNLVDPIVLEFGPRPARFVKVRLQERFHLHLACVEVY